MVIVTDRIHSINPSRFFRALETYRSFPSDGKGGSIGTVGEKSLHAVLKWYYEPDGSRHEQAVGTHIADIVGEEGIIEIQTRGLAKLKPKLAELLELCRVTVVHPVIVSRRIISMDAATGEILSVRKSPRHGSLYTEMRELYALRDLLPHEHFTLKLPMLTADEYRRFGVRTNRRRKQRTRRGEFLSDIVPTDIIDEITLSESQDFRVLIPDGLPAVFTSAEFAQAASTDEANARMAIILLTRMELAVQTGKRGQRKEWKLLLE